MSNPRLMGRSVVGQDAEEDAVLPCAVPVIRSASHPLPCEPRRLEGAQGGGVERVDLTLHSMHAARERVAGYGAKDRGAEPATARVGKDHKRSDRRDAATAVHRGDPHRPHALTCRRLRHVHLASLEPGDELVTGSGRQERRDGIIGDQLDEPGQVGRVGQAEYQIVASGPDDALS